MSEDQIIALLTEIRDLQKQSIENYKVAMQKQQDAVELQQQHVAPFQNKFVARQKMVVITVIVVTVIAFLLFAISSRVINAAH
jgi:hypothetical protein